MKNVHRILLAAISVMVLASTGQAHHLTDCDHFMHHDASHLMEMFRSVSHLTLALGFFLITTAGHGLGVLFGFLSRQSFKPFLLRYAAASAALYALLVLFV